MRKDITFSSGQDKCEGWFYQPDVMHDDARLPLIVMAHGFSGVKEQGLAAYAEKYLAAGFAVLVFDFRHFGGSSGEPRCQLFPLDMVEDYRNAITWACLQPVIDANRVGLWGTSFSGGIATYAATIDPRVKAVVAQAPSLMNAETRRAMDPDKWQTVAEFLTADRVARYEAGTVNTIPVVAPDGTPCALMGQESYEFFEAAKAGAPTWRNEITLESLEKIREFDPVSLINMLSPTALLVIAAEMDNLIPLNAVQAAFDRALEPKKITVLPVGHFQVYEEPWMTASADEAIGWFDAHLNQNPGT